MEVIEPEETADSCSDFLYTVKTKEWRKLGELNQRRSGHGAEIGKESIDSKQLNHFSRFFKNHESRIALFLDFDSNQRIKNQLF